MDEIVFFSIFLVISLLGQGFFTMSEMAFVSFNRVKLAYYVQKKEKSAQILQKFFNRPGSLFGTTLIGVNFFLQLGSECGRRLSFSLGYDPDYAYLPQLLIVLLFAEFFPMIAARDHSHQIAMLTIRPINIFSKIFFPVIYLINIMNKGVMKLIKSPIKIDTSLSREELKSLMKDSEGGEKASDSEDLEPLIENIFSIRAKTPRDIMTPIKKVKIVSYDARVSQIESNLDLTNMKYIPLYKEEKTNIVAFAYTIDLLNLPKDEKINKIAKTPWYVVETNTIYQIIDQFRKNNQKQAVVLDIEGSVIGIISLTQIVEQIFSGILLNTEVLEKRSKFYINRSFPIATKLRDMSKEIDIQQNRSSMTLAQFMVKNLGYFPKDQEVVYIDGYELIYEAYTGSKEECIRVKSKV